MTVVAARPRSKSTAKEVFPFFSLSVFVIVDRRKENKKRKRGIKKEKGETDRHRRAAVRPVVFRVRRTECSFSFVRADPSRGQFVGNRVDTREHEFSCDGGGSRRCSPVCLIAPFFDIARVRTDNFK